MLRVMCHQNYSHGKGKCAHKTRVIGREMCLQKESHGYGNVPIKVSQCLGNMPIKRKSMFRKCVFYIVSILRLKSG